MNLLQTIEDSWGWVGIKPVEVVAVNDFANLIIKDVDGKYWRLCPEEVYCEMVADSVEVYDQLVNDKAFIKDWNMSVMVDEAAGLLGSLAEGEYFCLVIPGAADGEYGGANLKKAALLDIIKFSGDFGKKIKDLPDGTEIKFKEFK